LQIQKNSGIQKATAFRIIVYQLLNKGIATVNFNNDEWIFPFPIPANNEIIVLSDWMGNEIEINKHQAGVVLLVFLFQRGEGPEFFRRQMLTGNP
jgi:hypothetical protein